MSNTVVIVAAKRSPMGSFLGTLSSVSATDLAVQVAKHVLTDTKLDPSEIDEVLIGNVLQAGVGQAPARQVALKAGLPASVPATTVNKVCASGMKSIMLGAQSIMTGDNEVVLAGGMENMSQVPHYSQIRSGKKMGDLSMVDGLSYDGLRDAYEALPMGNFAERCAEKDNVNREEQDRFALQSYKRSAKAWEAGYFNNEVVPITYTHRRKEVTVEIDEEFSNLREDKIASLSTIFKKDGTVTAFNASTINDGASILLLMSEEKAKALGYTPLAKIKSYADAALEPEWFTLAPEKASLKALDKAGLSMKDIDYVELNEAFSVVGCANTERLGLDEEKVNVFGGAVSLGHPLGCSGARIVTTLINVLHTQGGKLGLAAICNGGGGASAIIIEKY